MSGGLLASLVRTAAAAARLQLRGTIRELPDATLAVLLSEMSFRAKVSQRTRNGIHFLDSPIWAFCLTPAVFLSEKGKGSVCPG